MVNITASHPLVNEISTLDFHRTVLPRTASINAPNDPVDQMPDRGTHASVVVVKEGTGANTARTPVTETIAEDAIRQGLQKIFPQVNKNLFDLFESLPHFLANSRKNNTNKSYINYFIK